MQLYQMIDKGQIEEIHETSLRVLEDVGVIMRYAPAVETLVKHGAKADGDKVYIPRAMVQKALEDAPSDFTLHSRNERRNVHFDTKKTHYCGPGGSSFVSDLDKGRRPSSREDFINLIKLFQSLELIEMHHVPCEMREIDLEVRNKVVVFDAMKYSDKPVMPFAYTHEEAVELIEMASLPFGGLQEVKDSGKHVILADPCTITPLCYDDKSLSLLMAFAEYGQIQLINSLAMAGATAPTTLAGNIAVQNAEILAGIALAQCINPGTPIIYSASGSSASAKTMGLTVGSPDCAMMSIINGQLAKFYNLPCRISGAITDSKCLDMQAGFESMMNLMTAVMAGGNFVLHSGGILATYDTVSFEKAIIDYETVGYVNTIANGIEVDEESLAFETIEEVGPQGAYVMCDHTLDNYDIHYMPTLSDVDNVAKWEESGSLTIEQRANARWKEILESYIQPNFSAELERDLAKHIGDVSV